MSSTIVPEASWWRRLPPYVCFTSLVDGRNVLEVGCGDGFAADLLASRGAERVVAVDTDQGKVTSARRQYRRPNLDFAVSTRNSLPVGDGDFDTIFVTGGAWVLQSSAMLDELRRVLRDDGVLVVQAASADVPAAGEGAAGYYDFQDRLESRFGAVRMVAQMPFVALTLVEYRETELEAGYDLDNTLAGLGPESPVVDYIAICGAASGVVIPSGFTVVQLPTSPPAIDSLRASVGGEPLVAPDESPLKRRVLELEAELARYREAEDARTVSELVAAALDEHRVDIGHLERELGEREEYAEELHAECARARDAARVAEARAEAASASNRALQEELQEWRDRASKSEGALLRAREELAAQERTDEANEPAAALTSDAEAALKAELAATNELLVLIENELAELRAEAAQAARERAPSTWAMRREAELRRLAGEAGGRDAEITLLQAGLAGMRKRVAGASELVRSLATRREASPDIETSLDKIERQLRSLL